MPSDGIRFADRENLMTIDELTWLSAILVTQGISKIRITGGEPFARKNLMQLLRNLSKIDVLSDISITTNATLIGQYIDELKVLGINKINVSLDAVKPETFAKITRRDLFDTVYQNLLELVEKGFIVKINFVVLEGQNIEDILPMLELTRKSNLCVRFLEEMPFNGGTRKFNKIHWDYKRILKFITQTHSNFQHIASEDHSTSQNYRIEGFKGSFGIIPSFSRTFCGSCNRLRISATGDIMTCLYSNPVLNLRELLRYHVSELDMVDAIKMAIGTKEKNGFISQEKAYLPFSSPMTSIGG